MPVTANGNVVDGDKAKDIILKKSLEKSDLNKSELEFILSKLRNAEYKGHEFERFYVVWVKLNSFLEKFNK